ncbi:MAG: hypothetical protein QW469_00445 [Candidatus Aenigmatarchaeota archaeon]
MTIIVNDIYNLIKDYCRHENLDENKAIRAINSACDIVFNQIGIPSQEKEYVFSFDESQTTYSLPTDFNEAISLRYEDDKLNRYGRFMMRPVEYLYEKIGFVSSTTRLFGIDSASGSWRLFVLAKNSKASLLIDAFDINNANNWTALNDAENISDDRNTYQEGVGSLSFDINPTSSGLYRATLKRVGTEFNLKEYQNNGIFKCWIYLPAVNGLTSISFNWGSSNSDYYKQTITTQQDGTAFEVGWNEIAFNWNGAVQLGSPDLYNINTFWFDFDYEDTYVGGVNYRIDYLRIISPDNMILTYYTKYKGTDSEGTTYKENFTALTDKLLIGDFDVGLTNIIAIYASLLLKPQLLQESNWIKEQYALYVKTYQKKYPRKRANNLLTIPSLPKTN